MRKMLFLLPLAALLVGGCDKAPESPEKEPVTEEAVGAGEVYEVICGCALESVGHCSEYIKVGDEYVELTDHGLDGAMPFCGKQGLQASVSGEVKDGKFHATSFTYVN